MQIGGYVIPYFSKNNLLTKDHIIKIFSGDLELCKYLPDKVNKFTITRCFLLSLLFNVHKEKYLSLYNLYKKEKASQSFFCGKVYEIDVTDDFEKNINEFTTIIK